jgi:hypothetical protein
MFTYLLLPYIAFAKFTSFSNFLNNSNFNNKVSQNDHTEVLTIEVYNDDECNYYETEGYLDFYNCYGEDEESFQISNCYDGHFDFTVYYGSNCRRKKKNSRVNTDVCYDGYTYRCTEEDTPNDDSSDTENLYDSIEIAVYNNNCNRRTFSYHLKIGECFSNFHNDEYEDEDGKISMYPLYINDEMFTTEVYFDSNRCIGNYEVQTFNTNQCFELDENENVIFSGYNDNDDIHPVVATILGIASTLFCCCIFILLLRCCCVQNPFGRSQPVVQPVVQMVPQNQLPQIMVQQPQMVQATAPGEQAPVPAYTYPHLNNDEPENNKINVIFPIKQSTV